MFFYQERDIAGCFSFFGRPLFGGLGTIPDALGCVSTSRGVRSDRGAAAMLRHAPGVPETPHLLPNASEPATRTPELMESTLTRQILSYQKIGNFGFLDKKHLYIIINL